MSFFRVKKPYTSVTVTVDLLTHEDREESINDLSCVSNLIEAVSLQDTGPKEAARAFRKRLKYGNPGVQLRALTILNHLLEKAGPKFQKNFVDTMLIERLKLCGLGYGIDYYVQMKCLSLFKSWINYKNTEGLEVLADLSLMINFKDLKSIEIDYQIPEEIERRIISKSYFGRTPNHGHYPTPELLQIGLVNGPMRPFSAPQASNSYKSSSKKAIKGSDKQKGSNSEIFKTEEEKDTIKKRIAEASVAGINLTNTLRLLNKEEDISANKAAIAQVETCRSIRKIILDYIENINYEEWLGPLLQVNDVLVTSILAYKNLDQSKSAENELDNKLDDNKNDKTNDKIANKLNDCKEYEEVSSMGKQKTISFSSPMLCGKVINSPKNQIDSKKRGDMASPKGKQRIFSFASSLLGAKIFNSSDTQTKVVNRTRDKRELERSDENDPFSDRYALEILIED